jgi:probable F420-dependent oxidoreductase
VEFGLLYDFRNPPQWRVPTADLYAETLDHIQAAEGLGFPTVWVTEHHFIEDEYLPSVMPAAAAIAVKTSRVTIGTCVLLLPLTNAIHVAEESAVVDNLSNGRFRLGIGLGYKLEEFEALGVNRQHRKGLMDEGVEVIKRAWTQERFSFHGKHYNFDDLSVTPKPAQKGGPPIWFAGRAEAPIRRAAREGDGIIIAGAPDLFPVYLNARREYGRTGPDNLGTFAFTYPSKNPGATWEEIGPHVRHRFSNYADWYGAAGDLEVDKELLRQVSGGQDIMSPDIAKNPDATIAEIKAFEAMGVSSLVYFATLPGLRPSATMPIFETLAREVMPAFT